MNKTDADHTSGKWMPCPKINTEHPGLAYICPLNELIISKEKGTLHNIIGLPGVNYTIFNKDGQKVFLGVHKKTFKKFDLKIFNIYGNEVIQVRNHGFCLTRIFVWAPPGNFVGSVTRGRPCGIYLVKNSQGQVVLRLRPKGFFRVVYDVMTDDDHIGLMAPRWKSTDVLNFKASGVSFPIDIDVGYKAVLLGACFLLVA